VIEALGRHGLGATRPANTVSPPAGHAATLAAPMHAVGASPASCGRLNDTDGHGSTAAAARPGPDTCGYGAYSDWIRAPVRSAALGSTSLFFVGADAMCVYALEDENVAADALELI